jgi:prevent-host-death family protein
MVAHEHEVGLRQLRHETSAVLARVRAGETVDITAHGRLVARLVPAGEPASSPIVDELIRSGRLVAARRPGYRPTLREGDGRDRLGEALAESRSDESW